jgi:hypothetical protein
MLHFKRFLITIGLCLCAILGAWLGGATVTPWAFILAFVFSVLLVAVMFRFPAEKNCE